jgi:hypothetical protein
MIALERQKYFGGYMAEILTKSKERERLRRNEQKWTPTLMAAGWTVIPTVILERQQALGLDAVDINIILHLIRHWWVSDRPPYPTKKTIAECMGIDESTVRRRIAAMEKGGIIRRNARFDPKYGGQRANEYHFDGLIEGAKPFAEEKIREQKQRQKEDAEKRTRKRPKLSLINRNDEEKE